MRAMGRSLVITRTVAVCALLLLGIIAHPRSVQAAGSPNPVQSNSFGLEGRVSAPAPTQAATITTPRSGQTFASSPVVVAGLCKTDLLVKVFANNVFVGAVICKGGSFSLRVGLFAGRNDLVARVYDSLDQAGPDSNVRMVTFRDANFVTFGTQLTLTSNYARRGANTGNELTWPVILSGGTGPYALSADWGDLAGQDLQSYSFAGNLTLKHTYAQAGIYDVTIKATDKNGQSAYLQVVAVSNGEPTGNQITRSGTNAGINAGTGNGGLQWYTFLPVVPLLFIAYWLGSRNELYMIRKRLDRARGPIGRDQTTT